MKSLALIITYEPDLQRLEQNLSAVCPQTDSSLVIDNGSACSADIARLAEKYSSSFVGLNKNEGIASALSRGMTYAVENGFEWVLSMDQDSVAEPDLVSNYIKFADSTVGAMTCIVHDRNFNTNEDFSSSSYEEIPVCITSGCFMRVSAYEKTPGYYPELFIDKVDYDICFSLREAGYKIVRIPYAGLLHEVGKGSSKKILWKHPVAKNHPSWRRYYMVRNAVLVQRRHSALYPLGGMLSQEIRDLLAVMFYEKEKGKKLFLSLKGFYDGYRMKIIK